MALILALFNAAEINNPGSSGPPLQSIARITDKLKKAFDAASQLTNLRGKPPLRPLSLDEVAIDGLWDSSLAKEPEALEQLADEALREHRSSNTRALEL